jgi:hypothetical protein
MLNASRIALALIFCAASLHAGTITGTVTNKTTNKPAGGDDVILLKLEGGMQEAARTKADAQGKFTINFPDDNAMHLVRVQHRGVNYHRPAPPGTTSVEVDVYDAAEKVEGIKQSFDIVRLEADATMLRVTEDFVLENNSNPPTTLISPRAFEIVLPEGAKIEESMAAGPGGMAIRTTAVATDQPNHYAFLFPIRPGEANYRVVYTMPYSGSAEIKPSLARTAENYAVSVPKSMTLEPLSGSRLQQKGEEMGLTVYVATNAAPGQNISYRVSGTGSAPQQPDQSAQTGGDNANRPGGGIGTPINSPDPLSKYRWWIIAAVALAMVAGAGYVMSRQEPSARASASPQPEVPLGGLLDSIKEEMFALERDRLEKKIDEAEYQRVRAALEVVLARAIDRQANKARA